MVHIVDVRDTVVPIRSEIRNAYIDFQAMTVSVVAVVTDVVRDGRPVVGFGFNSNGRYDARGLLRDRFIPRLLWAAGEDPASLQDESGKNLDPQAIWSILMRNEKPGGHGERSVAVGVLDMALWDATAKIAGVPLWRMLAERFNDGSADSQVFVYAAGGYYHPGKDQSALRDEMRSYVDRGYSAVKIKIGGTSLDGDLRRIEAVVDGVLDGQADRLAVDANGRFDMRTAIAYAEALAPLGLLWYEEPGDPLDFQLHNVLSEHYAGPLATGENLFSHHDARNLIRYGGMRPDRDILQFDPALSYGLTEYLRTLEVIDRHGWSRRRCIPHGGHQFALNIAAGLGLGGNESYPDVFEPFNGFADHIPVEASLVKLPDEPGLALETKSELYRTVLKPLTEFSRSRSMGTYRRTSVSAIRLCAMTAALTLAAACGNQQQSSSDPGGAWEPQNDVHLIIHASPGGSSDLMARTAAKILNEQGIVKRSVVAENRQGGSGAVAYSFLLSQSGNAHYIAAYSGTYIAAPAGGQAEFRYSNYSNYSVVAQDASVLAVSARSRYQKLSDLIQAAKDRPGSVRYGGTQTGGSDSIVHYLLQQKIGIEMSYVPFDGGGEASAALLGGNVDVISANPAEIKSLIDGGRVRPLAVSTTDRIPGLDIPTFREHGHDVVFTQARGFIGPPGVTDAQRWYWEAALTRMTESQPWQEYLRANFLQSSVHIGKQAQEYLDREWQKYVAIYKDLGLGPK